MVLCFSVKCFGVFLQQMWNQEKVHLKKFNELMVAYRVRPTVLLPFWNVAGFVLGEFVQLLLLLFSEIFSCVKLFVLLKISLYLCVWYPNPRGWECFTWKEGCNGLHSGCGREYIRALQQPDQNSNRRGSRKVQRAIAGI